MKSLKNYIIECYTTPTNTIGMGNTELSTDIICLPYSKRKKQQNKKTSKGVN